MLETIRKELHREYEDFETMYDKFIIETQDRNLELEIRYLMRMNKLNVTFMDGIIEQTFKAVSG